MNRQDRRKNKKAGKPVKTEPVYNVKPQAMVDAVLNGVGKDIMMKEIPKAAIST